MKFNNSFSSLSAISVFQNLIFPVLHSFWERRYRLHNHYNYYKYYFENQHIVHWTTRQGSGANSITTCITSSVSDFTKTCYFLCPFLCPFILRSVACIHLHSKNSRKWSYLTRNTSWWFAPSHLARHSKHEFQPNYPLCHMYNLCSARQRINDNVKFECSNNTVKVRRHALKENT